MTRNARHSGDQVQVSVPALKPLSTPQEVREATVRDYRLAADRVGLRIDPRELERQALADCELGGRVREDAAARPKVTPSAPRMDVEGEANKLGATTQKVRTRKAPLQAMHGTVDSDRWMHAKGRIARIIAGARPHKDPIQAFATCELPHLAMEIYRIRANLIVRKRMPRPGDEPNPYFGLSDIDANRLLQRQLEDVCDRSTGRLGPWRTPK